MVYSDNLLLNPDAGSGVQNWTVTSIVVANEGIQASPAFKISAGGKMSQQIVPVVNGVAPEDFKVDILFKVAESVTLTSFDIKLRAIVNIGYADGTIDECDIPLVYSSIVTAELEAEGFVRKIVLCPVYEYSSISYVKITIENSSTQTLLVDSVTLHQNTSAEGEQGPPGEQGTSYRATGPWESGKVYVNNAQYIDTVTYQGSTYYCKITHTSLDTNKPSGGTVGTDTVQWGVLAMQGAQGPIGPTGSTGPIGPTGVSYRNMGGWVNTTSYVNNSSYIDTVNYNGSLYACKVSNSGQLPTNTTYWTLLVSKGDTGATGPAGPTLDWITEWNGTRVVIKGDAIVTPKIFAGINGGTAEEPLLTGIAIGRDVLGGTDTTIGIVTYNANIPTINIKTDGTAVFGAPETRQIVIGTDGSVQLPKILAAEIEDLYGTIAMKVVADESYKSSVQEYLDGKVDVSALSGYTTSDYVAGIVGRLEDVEGGLADIDLTNYVTKGDLTLSKQDLTVAFASGGGVNILKNSVGLAGTDMWTITGSVVPIYNDEIVNNGGMGGFRITAGQAQQVAKVRPGLDYTLSCMIKKDSGTKASLIVTNAQQTSTITLTDANYYGYEVVSVTFKAIGTEVTITLKSETAGVATTFINTMFNLGTVAFQWQHAPDELYNTNIQMNRNGIKVLQKNANVLQGYTVMTPVKFAGYYDVNQDGIVDETANSVDEVFRMDKDLFLMKKAVAKDEITMGTLRALRLNSGGNTGWAFIAVV